MTGREDRVVLPSALCEELRNDRPSRFDRKFYFELPAQEERLRYASRWNDALQAEMRLEERVLAEVVMLTDGFSFAYMKELFVSATMQWINSPARQEMGAVMLERACASR